MKKLIALLLALSMLFVFTACANDGQGKTPGASTGSSNVNESTGGSNESTPSNSESTPSTTEGTASSGDKLLIGWSGMFLDEQQTRLMNGGQGFVDANSDRYDLYYISADNSTEKQLSDVENLISMGADCIIIDEIDPVCSSAAVTLCHDAGVLCCAASPNLTEAPDFEFVIDAELLGEAQGQAVEAWFQQNEGTHLKAGYILGTTSQQQTWDTKDGGYAACFDARIASGDLEIIAEDTADWLTADAVTLVENWLLAYPDMNAVIAQNDDMALGAVQAAKAAGKNLGVDFWIFGKDGSETGRAALKNGEIAASVYLGFEGWGYTELKMLCEEVEKAKAAENFEFGQKISIVLDPATCWQPILPETVDDVIAYFDSLTADVMSQ